MSSDREKCVDDLLVLLAQVDLSKTKDELGVLQNRIQAFIDNNRDFIPPYFAKKASDALKNIASNSQTTSVTQFKFNSAPSQISKKCSEPDEHPPKPSSRFVCPDSQTGKISRSNLKNVDIVLTPSEVNDSDISLSNIEECNVVITGLANTVYISHVKNSSISICLARRAISVNECHGSLFRFACQQLRINCTQHVVFEVYVSTRAMLEDSRDLTFKQMDLQMLDGDLFSEAKFEKTKNNWKCIDDFDWLVPGSPSTNYNIVD